MSGSSLREIEKVDGGGKEIKPVVPLMSLSMQYEGCD